MNQRVLSKYLFLLFCFTLLSIRGVSQLKESEIKAAYLLNFLDNLTFSNQSELDSLHIVILDNDEVFQATSKIAKSKKVKDLFVVVSNHKVKNTQLVYLPQSSKSNFKDLALTFQQSAIVSDDDHYLVDIHFVQNEDESISFVISDNNLKNKNITPSSQLLVYSENKTEVLSLIDSQQKELNQLVDQSKKLSQELDAKEEEVTSLNNKIKQKEDRLVELNSANSKKTEQLSVMQEQIAAKENELSQINNSFLSQNEELAQLKIRMEENYAAINSINDSLSQLQNLLDEKKKLVQENEALLIKQKNELATKDTKLEVSHRKANRNLTLLLIAGIFAVILIILLYFYSRENKAKKEALVTIEKQNRSIQEASKLKDEFISNLSHEVRSPLNAIIGYADLIHGSIKNPETKKNIEYITMSSRNLLGMINDILDYRKIESGKGQLEFDNFELESVVQVVFNTLKITAENKGLEYQLIYDPTLPQFVYSDSKKISQILLNLISNAIKFTSDGKVEVRVKRIAETDEKCKIRFCVADTGIGIDKENQNLIFETFTQETDLTAKEFGGSGLGLSISRKLIELFGGTISVNSEPGEGAVFSFELDLKISKEGESSNTTTETVIVEGLEGLKILVVDDLLINRNLMLKQFEFRGCKDCVQTAENGLEALDMISKNDYDIILTDIRMPVMNGVELTKVLRKNGFEAPIIGVSANDQQSEKKECLSAGMNGYIVKPYSFDALLIEIADSLYLKYHKENNSIKNENGIKFDYNRIKDISETEEEFNETKEELLKDFKTNIEQLKSELTIEVAHSNVNKAAYFGNNNFLDLCRLLENEIRSKKVAEAKELITEIEEKFEEYT